MPIIKVRQTSGFAQIANSTLRDKRLKLDTRGYLGEILSHVEGLDVSVEWLLEHFSVGRDKLFRMNKELKDFGYLETPSVTNDKGQFEGKEWFFYGVSAEVRETLTTGKPDYSYKREDQEEKREENEDSPSGEKVLFVADDPSAQKPHGIWADFKELLKLQGKDGKDPGGMIQRLMPKYGAERVSRVYLANHDLIFKQVDSYAYLITLLDRDKELNKDEGEIQTALREARLYHNQMNAGLDHIPAFDPANYVTKWPALQKYLDEIASGIRQEPVQDKKARENEQKFNDSVLEQARYYGRI